MPKKQLHEEKVLVRLAVAFAISNMGQKVPDYAWEGREHWGTSIEGTVNNLCEPFMETMEHERIFMSEAKMWYRDLKKRSSENILRMWPSDFVAKILVPEAADA